MNGITTLPRFDLAVDGVPLPPPALAAITGVQVRQVLGLPAQCEVTFTASLLAESPWLGWRLGAGVRLTTGDGGSPLFTGEVTALTQVHDSDGAVLTRVRAYDRLHRLRKRQTLAPHVDVTAAALAAELTASDGLTVAAEHPGPQWPLLLQRWPSDFDLLAEVAWRAGLYPVVQDGTLRLVSLAGHGEPVALTPGDNLLEVELEQNTDGVCDTVYALGWDAGSAAEVGGYGATAAGEALLASVITGVEAATDVALPTGPTAQLVGGSGERRLFGRALLNDEHAAALGQAELARRAASGTVVRGCAEGNPRLQPGVPVEVPDGGPLAMQRCVLTEATHTLDPEHGYLTTFSSDPPARPVEPLPLQMVAAEVSSVDDPEQLGRVRVTLPSFGGVETGWMGVVAAGAGSGKGLVALPDTGDRVLLLLAEGDPGQGVVLGGLYGAGGAPGQGGVMDGGVRRYSLLTAGGHRLEFDDAGHRVALRAANGSLLELAPDLMRLSAATDLTIEAPGHAVVVRAKTVDFQQAEGEEAPQP